MLTQLPLVPVLLSSKAAADNFHIAWGLYICRLSLCSAFHALTRVCSPSLIFRGTPLVAPGLLINVKGDRASLSWWHTMVQRNRRCEQCCDRTVCDMMRVSILLDLASSRISSWWQHLAPYRALQLDLLVLSIACLRRL